jgi:NADH:ubiquinone oxidoreductase subunit 2 (subunit N)
MKASLYILTLICIISSVVNGYVYIKLIKNIWFDDITYFSPTDPICDSFVIQGTPYVFIKVLHGIFTNILVFFIFLVPTMLTFCKVFVFNFLYLV